MSARERVITIRLIEKLQVHPAYAKALGIEINIAQPAEAIDKEK